MQSRRDHVHAYQFATGRLAAALVTGEPATGEPPARRSVVGAVIGVVLAILACVGFAVYGLIRPGGNTAWAKPNAIVVEKETGSRFLYLDGVLHPVANYASALLGAAGSETGGKVHSVSRNSLSGVRHGGEVGIPGAPDTVPSRTKLLPGEWSRCLTPGRGSGQTLDFTPSDTPADERSAARRRVLLRDDEGTLYVLWNGTRYQLSGRSALVTLELDGQDPLTAPDSWLEAIPSGPSVAAASVPSQGEPGPRIAGRDTRVGQAFSTGAANTGHAQYYVLRSDGLAPLSHTEFALLAARSGQDEPRQVTPADIAAAPGSKDRSLLHRLPDFLSGPVATSADHTVCLRQRTAGTKVSTTVTLEPIPAADTPPVTVPVSAGLLLETLPLPAQGQPRLYYLVTELGLKYPVADDQTLSALGFATGQSQPVPRAVLDLLPTGPELSREGALAAVPVSPDGSATPTPTASKGG
ncbi:type VII secretion protein EccB [Streptomyces flaveolus]|uniref:type VII secretion protein EccB n=1 Tax=Streptomyces flaveolus TaxID=67297 RepID=UPI0036F5E9AE